LDDVAVDAADVVGVDDGKLITKINTFWGNG